MISQDPKELRIRQAAFALALERPWKEIGLADIARKAEMDLVELRAAISSKAAILQSFFRSIDEAMLLLVAKDPPSGEPHDRLFDVIVKRLEILRPYHSELRHIVAGPHDPSESLALLKQAATSMNWVLAAAGLENDSRWRGIGFAGLLFAYARAFQTWLHDEDPALGRTMASLDRQLRDAEQRAAGLANVRMLALGLSRAARIFFAEVFDRRKGQP